MNVVAILLAAGSASRFGSDKLLHALPHDVPIAIQAARHLKAVFEENVVVVIRPESKALAALLRTEGCEVVVCENAAEGMGASLACAVRAANEAAPVDGYLIALADMPFIRSSTIAAVRDALVAGAPLVAPYFRARRGHPVGIGAKFRTELEALRGDEGARKIIAANETSLLKVPVGDPGVLRDIDTPGDLTPPAIVQPDCEGLLMPGPQMALQLIYRAHIFVVNQTRHTLQMGRDDSNDIVIVSLSASRLHARVQARDGRFVLTDLSSNGTFVLVDGHEGAHPAEARLRQDEAVLSGRGWLGMGRSAATHGDHAVRFMVQPEIV